MLKEKIAKLVEKSIKEKKEVLIEKPREKSHGDYSTNIALKIKGNPMENAVRISKSLDSPIFSKVEVAKPGFINFFLSKEYLQKQVKEILKQGNKFGDLKIGKNQKVNIEFISANPTGPLTLGNGRGGFGGDVLSNVLERAGYKVDREYYVNDTGVQVKKLGHSVLKDSQAVYKGEYIDKIKVKGKDPQEVGEKAAKIILKDIIKPSVKKMEVKFDTWFSQKSLNVDKVLKGLKELTYEKDKALWFKSTKFKDEKDRVLIKEDGEKTYLAYDIAYLKNKIDRGFNKLIFFWGADHHGYINRIKGASQALSFKGEVDIIIMQMVRIFQKGKEVRMSKRTGSYITLDELINEVGLDVARFFFLMRGVDSHLNFDMDLAKEQSKKNPVYYIQYAHARIFNILKKSKEKPKSLNLKLLDKPTELALIKELIRFPEIIEETAQDYQTYRIPQYAVDLADSFHQFYENCRVISEDKKLTQARLSLISAVKVVLKNTLDLMGISAPDKM